MNGKITIEFDNDGVLADIKLQSTLQERLVLVEDILPEIFDKLRHKLLKEMIINSIYDEIAERERPKIEVSGEDANIDMKENL